MQAILLTVENDHFHVGGLGLSSSARVVGNAVFDKQDGPVGRARLGAGGKTRE
ncbi:hypothetical protein LP419_32285 [Massilia sp. H-1]|nr:hypothetical protein LP419_32285 [Massilia sp. H-1]